jgi:hypothetical protein
VCSLAPCAKTRKSCQLWVCSLAPHATTRKTCKPWVCSLAPRAKTRKTCKPWVCSLAPRAKTRKTCKPRVCSLAPRVKTRKTCKPRVCSLAPRVKTRKTCYDLGVLPSSLCKDKRVMEELQDKTTMGMAQSLPSMTTAKVTVFWRIVNGFHTSWDLRNLCNFSRAKFSSATWNLLCVNRKHIS